MKTLFKFEYLGKKLAIKKPTRLDLDEADLQFSSFFSDCIKRGILTREMLVREYKNFGGAFSEEENKDYQSVLVSYLTLQKEIEEEDAKEEKDSEKVATLRNKQNTIFETLHAIQTSQEGLFTKTADIIARDKTLFFLTFLLAAEEQDGSYVPYYKGGSHDERYDYFESLSETNDEEAQLLFDRFAALVSFWYFSDKKEIKEENFQEYEKILDGEKE